MKSGLWLNLWRSLWAAIFLALAVRYGLAASGYTFSLRMVATLGLLLGWFFSEATRLSPQLLSEGLKRVAGGMATFLLIAGALVFLLMFTGRLAPSATFLEAGLAGLLAFSRINAHFDLGTRMWRWTGRASNKQEDGLSKR